LMNMSGRGENNMEKDTLRIMLGEAAIMAMVCVAAAFIGCPLKKLLGIPCPVCGMTRAGLSLLHGEIGQSFYYHPLLILVVIGAVTFLFRYWIPKKVLKIGGGLFCVLFIGVYLYRMLVLKSEVVQIHFEEGWVYFVFSKVRELM